MTKCKLTIDEFQLHVVASASSSLTGLILNVQTDSSKQTVNSNQVGCEETS